MDSGPELVVLNTSDCVSDELHLQFVKLKFLVNYNMMSLRNT